MQFVLENWILILIALTSGAMLFAPTLQGGGAGLSPSEAVTLVNREKAVLIDVCEPNEFASAHVAGARNIPLGNLEGHRNLPANKATPIILVCQSGARSGRGVAVLRKAGYENVRSLTGGLASWREASLPVEKGGAGGKDKERS